MARRYRCVGNEVIDNTDHEVVGRKDADSFWYHPKVRNHIQKKAIVKAWERVNAPDKPKEPKKDAPVKTAHPPKGDPRMGDKDPAVMAWYEKHRPEIYKKKYGTYLAKLKGRGIDIG